MCAGLGCDFHEDPDPGIYFDDIVKKYKEEYNIDDQEKKKINSPYFHKVEKIGKEDRHTFVLLLKPSISAEDIAFSRYIVKEARAITTKAGPEKYKADITFAFTGRYKKKTDSIDAIGQDFNKVSLIAFTGVLLILIIYFRSFWPILIVILSLMMGILWTFAMTQILFKSLNLVTSILLAVLVGIGIDFGIHFLVRYKEERERGCDIEEAFKLMITQVGLAAITSGITTSFAFFVLNLSGFKAFAELGNIAGVGVLLIFMAMMFFLGPSILIVEHTLGMKFNKKNFSLKIPGVLYKSPVTLLALTGVLILVSIWGLKKVKFDYDFAKLLEYPTYLWYKLDKEVDKMFDTTTPPVVILPRDRSDEKNILKLIDKHIDKMKKEKKSNRFLKVVRLTTFVPENQDAKLVQVKKIRNLIESNQKYKPLLKKKVPADFQRFEKAIYADRVTVENLPSSIRNNFLGRGKHSERNVILLYPDADFSRGDHITEFAEQVWSIKHEGKPLKIASGDLLFAEVLKLITNDGYRVLFYCFLGVYLLVALNMRSGGRALLVTVPLALGIYWLAGFMGILGVPLDYFNVIIFPIIIGIGIDSGVHIFMRYLESRDIILAVQNTGEAVALSSLTTLVGFGALSMGKNEGLAGMGQVAVIGLISTYLVSVFVLPALILIIERRSQKKKA